MELIDKSAIVAEINRVLNSYDPNEITSGRYALIDLRDFLDTLKTKDVDLEKEIKNRINSLSNLYCYMEDLFNGNEEEGVYPIPEKVTNELFEFAKYFFELGLKMKGE